MSGQPSATNIWTHYQGQGKGYGFTGSHGRHAHLLRKMSRLTGRAAPHVLNVGIGDANLEQQCLRRGWSASSLDPDEQAVRALCDVGIDAKAGSVSAIPFADGQFDFAVASEVLEHLTPEERAQGLRELRRVLKPGGYLLGTVPYRENLDLAVTVCPECSHVFHRWGHTTSFDLDSMRRELTEYFGDVACYRVALVEFAGRSLTGKAKSLIRWMLGRFGAAITVPSLVFVARKK